MGVEDSMEIVAPSGNMHLIVPEKQWHQRKSVEGMVILLHSLGKFLVIMLDLGRMVSYLLAEELPHA